MPLSTVQQRGPVGFPAFTGECVYMREFTRAAGVPVDLARWQPTVDAMLDGVDAEGPIFLMVDQAHVRASQYQRRPGVHIDGDWLPSVQAHGTGPGRHRTQPSPRGVDAEAIILASDVLGCAAYVGGFEGEPAHGGGCSHLDVSRMRRVELAPGQTMSMLHESIPVHRDCLRTVVRLNVKGLAAA